MDVPSYIKWNQGVVSGKGDFAEEEYIEWAICTYPHDFGFEYVVPISEELALEFVKSFVSKELFEEDSLGGLFWSNLKKKGFCNKYAFIVRRARFARTIVGVYLHDWQYWMIRKEVKR